MKRRGRGRRSRSTNGDPLVTMFTTSETIHLTPITPHHGFLLFPAPTLDLQFRSQGFFAGGAFLRPRKFDRQTFRRVSTACAGLMLTHAFFKVVGVPCVVRTISTTKDVNPEGHCINPRLLSRLEVSGDSDFSWPKTAAFRLSISASRRSSPPKTRTACG